MVRLLAALLLGVPVSAYAQAAPCTDLPANLMKEVAGAAAEHMDDRRMRASGQLPDLALLAALQSLAVGPIQDITSVPAETSDTTKHTGGSSRSGGAAALVEKPSFATLLALAVESGAVDADGSDTQLTLSSSLYALAASIKGDSARTYRQSGFFTRVGLAATFDAVADAPDPLASARRDQLREWAVKVRLSPDRSVRSRGFEDWWQREIRSVLAEQNMAMIKSQGTLENVKAYRAAYDAAEKEINDQLDAALNAGVDRVKQLYVCTLQARIIEPIANGSLEFPANVVTELRTVLVPTLVKSSARMGEINQKVQDYLDDVSKRPTAAIAFKRMRPVEGHDFWETSFSYSQKLSPLTAFISAGVSRYVGRDGETEPVRGWRDVVVAASLEHSTRGPFARATSDLSQVTIALTAAYERVFDHSSTFPTAIGSRKSLFQARVELPLTLGVILPISFSMSNDPALIEEDKKWDKGMFFGLTFDLDKFTALTKALAAARR